MTKGLEHFACSFFVLSHAQLLCHVLYNFFLHIIVVQVFKSKKWKPQMITILFHNNSMNNLQGEREGGGGEAM
jgi:hypothetical protein